MSSQSPQSLQSPQTVSLQEETQSFLAKQEEFRQKILARRAVLMAEVADLDALLSKLAPEKIGRFGRKPTVRNPSPVTEIGGDGGIVLTDDGEDGEDTEESDGGKTSEVPLDNKVVDETTPPRTYAGEETKISQLLFFVRKRGEVTRREILEFFPYADGKERTRTYAMISKALHTGKLREKPNGKIVIVMP
jgi:hypothetical protein